MGNSLCFSRHGHRQQQPPPPPPRMLSVDLDDPFGLLGNLVGERRHHWQRRRRHERRLPAALHRYASTATTAAVAAATSSGSNGGDRERDCIRRLVRFMVDNYDNDTNELQKRIVYYHLHELSASEATFLAVIDVLLDEVPIDHCLGGSIVAMVIGGGCLPTKELLSSVLSMLNLSTPTAAAPSSAGGLSETRQKNGLSAVAAFAGRLSGAMPDRLVTDSLLAFLRSRLARVAASVAGCAEAHGSGDGGDSSGFLAKIRSLRRDPWFTNPTGLRRDQLEVALSAALLLQTFMHTLCEPERRRLLDRLAAVVVSGDDPDGGGGFADLLASLEAGLAPAGHGPARQLASVAALLLDGYLRPAGRQSAWSAGGPAAAGRRRRAALLSPLASTEAVQLLPDGLEARSDASGFETAVCSRGVSSAAGFCFYYYEVTLVTAGVMQIGWASTQTTLLRDEGIGVGDDPASAGLDGCRRCVWHRGLQERRRYRWRRWRPGDVVGCSLAFVDDDDDSNSDEDGGGDKGCCRPTVRFSLNGNWSSGPAPVRLAAAPTTSAAATVAYRPAASFMAGQQCRFNFGAEPFRYRPPSMSSMSPTSSTASVESAVVVAVAVADDGEKAEAEAAADAEARDLLALPWPLAARERRRRAATEVGDDDDDPALDRRHHRRLCLVCADRPAGVRLVPCGHAGLCAVCPGRLLQPACPLCRAEFERWEPAVESEAAAAASAAS